MPARDLETALREARFYVETYLNPHKDGWIEEKHALLARIDAALSDASGDAEIVVKRRDGVVRLFARNGDRLALLQSFSECAWELVVGPTVTALPDAASGEAGIVEPKSLEELDAILNEPEPNVEVLRDGSCRPAPSESPNVERDEETAQRLVSQIARSGGGTKSERDLTRALDSARAEGIAAERERCEKIVNEWLNMGIMKLRAGELTAQEGRTVKAVVSAIAAAIRAGAKP